MVVKPVSEFIDGLRINLPENKSTVMTDAVLQSTERDYINHFNKNNARAKLIGLQLLASLGAPITGLFDWWSYRK